MAGPEQPVAENRAPSPRRRWVWKVVLAAIVMVCVVFLLRLRMQAVGHRIMHLLERTRDLGPWGPVCFAAMECVGTVLLVSSSFMLAAAGFLFGMAVGLPTVTIGNMAGALAAFILGRTLLRGWAERKMAGHPVLQALDRAMYQKGLKSVFLIRLTPAPSVLLNYGLGLTRVRPWAYGLGTVLGMVPRSLLYLYLGSTARNAAQIASGEAHHSPLRWLHLGVGILVAVAAAVFIGRLAQRALRQKRSSEL